MKKQIRSTLIIALFLILILPVLVLGETSLKEDQKDLREDKREKPKVETASEEDGELSQETRGTNQKVDFEDEEDKVVETLPPTGSLPKIHFGEGGYRSKNGNEVTMIYLKDQAPWCFFHVWDRTLDPITGSTGYMPYFILKDGDYAFCLNPTLPGPEGYLNKLFFPDSGFRRKGEKIATVALSSGGIPGYSFNENFVFAQMYLWQSIPLSDGNPRYEISFRNHRHWVEINEEITQRFNQWKREVDQRIEKLGRPSFHGKTILLEVGKEMIIDDTEGQLNQMSLRNQIDGLRVSQKGNQLILKATKAFPKNQLNFSYAKSTYPFPEESYILQGIDDSYQDLGAFSDPYASFVQIEAKETKGRIKIYKKDTKDRVIRGAVFELAKDEGFNHVVETLITDKNGQADSKDYFTSQLPVVYLREKSVPEPYILNQEIKKIFLEAGKTKEIQVLNQAKKVLLKKTDSETNEYVASAKVRVTNTKGLTKEYTTNQKGEILIEDLEAGQYTFREVQSPPGYVRSKIEHQFTLNSNGSIQGTVHWKNRKTKVVLIKKDFLTGKALPGVELSITNEKGEKQNYITDKNGKIKLIGLHKGRYEIGETKPPLGYFPLAEKPVFTIDQDGVLSGDTVVFNEPTEVVLKKKGVDGRALSEVCFNVYLLNEEKKALKFSFSKELGAYLFDENGEEELHSDKKGEITLLGLHPGKYKIKETSYLPGYLPLEKDPEFSLSEDGLVEGETELVNLYSRVLIKKKGEQGETLAGVGFKAYSLEEEKKALKFSFSKELGAYLFDENGEEELHSDKKGEITLLGLHPGKYKIKETSYLPGYLPLEKDPEFSLSEDGLVEGETELVNHYSRVLIKKKGEQGEALAGVGFKVYSLEEEKKALKFSFSKELGAYLFDENGEEELHSDKKGEITLLGLHPGKYKIKETSFLPGYLPLEKDPEFSLSEEGLVEGETELVNVLSTVILRKRNEEGKTLAGVDLKICLLDGKKTKLRFNYSKESDGYVFSEDGVEFLKTDHKGEIKLLGLTEGDYEIVEPTPLPGYLPLKQNASFSVDKTGKVSGQTEIVNKYSWIEFKKTNSKGIPLENVIFKVFRVNEDKKRNPLKFLNSKKLSGHLVDDNGEEALKTNEEGIIRLLGLPKGQYEIEEVKPLAGYVSLRKNPQFTISEKGEVEGDKEIINECTAILLRKKGDQNKALAQVGFQIHLLEKDRRGKALRFSYDKKDDAYRPAEKGEQELRTNKKGEIKILGLPLGSYVFDETDVPKGYVKADELRCSISEQHSESSPLFLEMKNNLEKVKEKPLPKTGENRSTWLLLVVLFFGTAGIFFLKRKISQ